MKTQIIHEGISIESVEPDSTEAAPGGAGFDEDHKHSRATKNGMALLFIYSASAFLLGLAGIIQLWSPVNEAVQANQPISISDPATPAETAAVVTQVAAGSRNLAEDPVVFLGFDITDPLTLVLAFVALAGILGSSINGLRSHAKHTAMGNFDLNYWAWYAIRPFVGSATALALYFLLTAGLITVATEEVGVLSPPALAAFSFVAGLASKAAIDRIRDAIESLFGLQSAPETDPEKIKEERMSEEQKGL